MLVGKELTGWAVYLGEAPAVSTHGLFFLGLLIFPQWNLPVACLVV